jgi:hypothetical protein
VLFATVGTNVDTDVPVAGTAAANEYKKRLNNAYLTVRHNYTGYKAIKTEVCDISVKLELLSNCRSQQATSRRRAVNKDR